jgi:hypothetical protein
MARTATLKRKIEAEPPAPDDRDDPRGPLRAAIAHRQQADAACARQREAIARAKQTVDRAEIEVELRRSKIAVADESDVKRAATCIKGEKQLISAWSGDAARGALRAAENHVELMQRASAKLTADLAALDLAAKVAANAVIVERTKIVAPVAADVLAEIKTLQHDILRRRAQLAVLLRDEAPKFPANDAAFMTASHADEARRKPGTG